MRADHLFPHAFHAAWQDRSAQHVHLPVQHLPRSSGPPPVYVFVDFSKSSIADPVHPHHIGDVQRLGLDEDFRAEDAYCVDIFTLGKVFGEFINVPLPLLSSYFDKG